MKIAAMLHKSIDSGGGFNQALNAIRQMQRLAADRFEFCVFTTDRGNMDYLRSLGIESRLIRATWRDAFLSFFATSRLWGLIQQRLRLIGPVEKALLAEGVDLVYYVTPSMRCLALQKLNYIFTALDTCHRDTPEFPEVREFGEFQQREHVYGRCMPPAILTLTDSEALSERIARRFAIDPERLLAMPFEPMPFIESGRNATDDKASVLARYHLEEGYFYYPAQIWPHKNHVRIVQALAELGKRDIRRDLVLSGGDKGYLATILRLAERLGVAHQIHHLGFVPVQDIAGLYHGCAAVVMPTYFGPTNLPPLEAWQTGRPLVYSNHLVLPHPDAALTADPDDPMSLAEAMACVLDPHTAERLIKGGQLALQQVSEQRASAEAALVAKLQAFSHRAETWRG
ncbi:MAG: glycosyltransferase [Proteobacteria bacterium]|jgi:glycosyltransferase involved in cell wall biosynthesis|nr:glycosyltransferase [Pseudomonadota bacterium]MDA1298814.1 glycosyltransferase [Pseudomonadota bacterium]